MRSAGQTDALIENLRKRLEAEPNNALLHRRYAAACHIAGRPAEALEHLRRAVDLSGRDSEHVLALAEALLDTGYPEQSLPLFDEAVGRLEGGMLRRAETGRRSAALETPLIQSIQQLLAAAPAPQKHLFSGTLLVLRGRRREATDAYAAALEAPQTQQLAAENVAFMWSIERNTGGPDVRVQDLLKAARSAAPSFRMELYLADAYSHSGMFESAAAHVAAALQKEPRYLPAYSQAAGVLRQLRLSDTAGADALREAIKAALAALETAGSPLAPLASRRFSRAGALEPPVEAIRSALASAEEFERTMAAAEALDSLPPASAAELLEGVGFGTGHLAGLLHARLLLDTAGVERAAECAQNALLAHPERADVAHAVAYFWGLRRRLVTAEAMLEAAGGAGRLEPARFLEVAFTYIEAGQAAQALEMCRGLAHVHAVVAKARALARLGRRAEALDILEAAAAGAEPPAELRRELARLYFLAGRDNDALALLTDGDAHH